MNFKKIIREEIKKLNENQLSVDRLFLEEILETLRIQFPMLGPWRLQGNKILFIGGDGAGGQEKYTIDVNNVPGKEEKEVYEVILRDGSGRIIGLHGEVRGIGGIITNINKFMNKG